MLHLRDMRQVVALLIVNFAVVPATAIAAACLLPMEEAAANSPTRHADIPREETALEASGIVCEPRAARAGTVSRRQGCRRGRRRQAWPPPLLVTPPSAF